MKVRNILVEISACKTTLGRPGRKRIGRTDRIVLTVESLMMKAGIALIGIGSRECKN